MKKIVFCDVPFQNPEQLNAQNYAGTGDVKCKYAGNVVFGINAVLADSLTKNDSVKVVLIKTVSEDKEIRKNTDNNEDKFKEELNQINESIKADIKYEVIESDYKETKQVHAKLIKAIIGEIEPEAELYADVTFGPKPLPMILMSAMSYAEKIYDAHIETVVYSKVDFVKNKDKYGDEKRHPENPELFDVTFLYYLNNLTDVLDSSSPENAMKVLDNFFLL